VTPARALRLLVASVALAVAAPAAAGPAVAAANEEGGSYVALGDSFTAGPLIPNPTGRPPGCLRSDRNYPSLVAERLGAAGFRDVSCSGATTDDLHEPQQVTGGANPPQLDALSAGAELVTLGIGGNDIGFAEIVQTCATRSSSNPSGAACRDHYTAGGSDQLAARIAATRPKVLRALAAIADRAPDASVLLVGYPVILPDEGPGCYPVVPLSPGDVAYLREVARSLNTMLADAAVSAGAGFVDTYTPSIGHDVCQLPGVKWVEGVVPTSPAAPVHPNALGMQATARAVLSQLGATANDAP
jgi:lysophospholipase L1-like esterase